MDIHPFLVETTKLPLKCTRHASPAEIVSAVEKVKQMHRCHLLDEELSTKVYKALERTVEELRAACRKWEETGQRADLDSTREALHDMASSLQRMSERTTVGIVEDALKRLDKAVDSGFGLKGDVPAPLRFYPPGYPSYKFTYH